MLDMYFKANFEAGRHLGRIKKIWHFMKAFFLII
jgi:hypothetical protein